MTKKYEKFDEWMVGERVSWEGNEYAHKDAGVVRGMDGADTRTVDVRWDSTGEEQWIDVSEVTFEKDKDVKEGSVELAINWEVGQVVWDTRFTHRGAVISVDTQFVSVKFGTKTGIYFLDGKSSSSIAARRVLFFSEPAIIADTMPPKKPFVPKLKEGDEVVMWFEDGSKHFTVVREETQTAVIDDNGDSYLKSETRFLKIGEEIKWES